MMRATLPRWVNACLGRIENWAGRIGNGVSPATFLHKVADYIEFYERHPTCVFHPAYKTPEERKAAARKRAAKKRKAKRGAAKNG